MKKILLLADSNSSHIKKWASMLSSNGFSVSIFTLSENIYPEFWQKINIQIHSFPQKRKFLYLSALPKLKKIISKLSPDILHAHYASSYGLLGAISKFHPYIISAWGSDIYSFPEGGFLQKRIIKYNFSKADSIFSTGNNMANEVKKYTSKHVDITPFGVDCTFFKKTSGKKLFEDNIIVIGTIKALEEIYGIGNLIKAFAIVHKNYAQTRLLICGGGSKETAYKALVKDLGIEGVTIFTGKVPYEEIASYHNAIDIFVNLSFEESFGVSVLEASACEKPVIVTSIGGLTEIVKDGVTGIYVSPNNVESAASAITKLIRQPDLAHTLGINGRKFVLENYNWEENSKHILKLYDNLLK